MKVGAVGLAIVVLLILVAGAILNAVARERPAATGANATATNMTAGNDMDAASEPLADMGVTPTVSNTVEP